MDISPAPVSSPIDPVGEPFLPALSGYPLSRGGRLFLALCGLMFVAGFLLAASLEPDPRGFGTHQRLGLPPCSFRVWFGVHCPSCGSTTSFSHFVRGEWASAFESNMAAFGLAVTCASFIPWSLYSAAVGRMWRIDQPAVVFAGVIGSLCVVSFGQWGVKLIVEYFA